MPARPRPDEHAPYYSTYIDRVPDGDILALLRSGLQVTERLVSGVEPDRETYRYGPGKWSIREVIGHIIDGERVFAGRAIWFARNGEGALPSMDQERFAAASNAGARPLSDLLEEFRAVRAATLTLFAGMDDAGWSRRGLASGAEVSVRALAWIIAGHERHHQAGLVRDYGL